ncbi:MAG TPA: Gfo/Idh/MocA family oxidoreductase [Clostridia bacterium]|nr:Gfo/Idh/MocA family oxidoreductase [Clostridia bacterium]
MLKVGLIGIGFMGRGHLDIYLQLAEEGYPVELVAICDIDEEKFQGKFLPGNLDIGNLKYDFSKFNLYTDMDEMLEKEELDYVDIALPTYLHSEASIKALNKGVHVLCEKPMALNPDECQSMIDASKANNKKLMVAQTLRFWPEYEYLKKCVDTEEYGSVVSAYFFRGGTTPKWSYENWLLDKKKSGGVLLDQHVHDVDTINWIFGTPKKLTSVGRNVFPGSGYDAVSTNYIYDNMVINAQDDWTINSEDFGFAMTYRVNFEKGALIYEEGKLTAYPHGEKSFVPEMEEGSGYYREIKYFIQAVINDTPIEVADVYSTMETIRIANAEEESADKQGELVEL